LKVIVLKLGCKETQSLIRFYYAKYSTFDQLNHIFTPALDRVTRETSKSTNRATN
jgi:hypothetical protein